ncbi:MAG TPA: tetratricopeptide repeat protein, partial [Terriglobia bacterium]|nr:tetratricopeptide repeat protein [Terriglobia bacterium]
MFERKKRWIRSRSWIPILILILTKTALGASGYQDSPQRLLNSGKQAFSNGNYASAENILRRAVREGKALNFSDSETALALADLGNLLLTQGQYQESEAFLEQSVALIRASTTADRRQLPIVMGNLGKLYQKTGRFKQSQEILNEALKLSAAVLREFPIYIADLHNNLGVLHLETGDTKQAERSFKKALALIEVGRNDDD